MSNPRLVRRRAGFGEIAPGEPGPVTLEAPTEAPKPESAFDLVPVWYRVFSSVSAVACTYHGYKRNKSAGWAVGWAIFGGALPLLALPIAFAQGFGERK